MARAAAASWVLSTNSARHPAGESRVRVRVRVRVEEPMWRVRALVFAAPAGATAPGLGWAGGAGLDGASGCVRWPMFPEPSVRESSGL